MGDLKSVVLHDMKATHIKSTFPMALGTSITGVDDKTFSSTGEAFSAIILPKAETTVTKQLQADDVSLVRVTPHGLAYFYVYRGDTSAGRSPDMPGLHTMNQNHASSPQKPACHESRYK